jgi:hypothetical protein
LAGSTGRAAADAQSAPAFVSLGPAELDRQALARYAPA